YSTWRSGGVMARQQWHNELNLLITVFFYNATATAGLYTLSLHDALPISSSPRALRSAGLRPSSPAGTARTTSTPTCPRATRSRRSEEHTSELQSQSNLVCRLLLEKKKKRHGKS